MSKTSFWLFLAWVAVVTYSTSGLALGHWPGQHPGISWITPVTIALSIMLMDYYIQKERQEK